VLVRTLLLVLLCLLSVLPKLARAETPPDIAVVLLDNLRASAWWALPQTRESLEDGTWFENFILTTPLCFPSRSSLLLGRYAHNHVASTNSIGWPAFRNDEATVLPLLPRDYDAFSGYNDPGSSAKISVPRILPTISTGQQRFYLVNLIPKLEERFKEERKRG
jgi:hypothetical protein